MLVDCLLVCGDLLSTVSLSVIAWKDRIFCTETDSKCTWKRETGVYYDVLP